jgi:hypothetical protein
MPLGPREVRSTRETALAAWMLLFTASIPLTRDFFSCSCRPGRGLISRAMQVERGSLPIGCTRLPG